MREIIRPDLMKFFGKEHKDTAQLKQTLQLNVDLTLTLLRRKYFFESIYALAKADKNNAEAWKKFAKECEGIYKDLWENELEDAAALELFWQALERVEVVKVKSETLREKLWESIRKYTPDELLEKIHKALQNDTWKEMFSESEEDRQAYSNLKHRFECYDIKEKTELFRRRYSDFLQGKGVQRKPVHFSEKMKTWCVGKTVEILTDSKEDAARRLQDDSIWESDYKESYSSLKGEKPSRVVKELLNYMDRCLGHEDGSTLKQCKDYERYEPYFREEETWFSILEGELQRLKEYQRKFFEEDWFEYWKSSEENREIKVVFFIFAVGMLRTDRTKFEKILSTVTSPEYEKMFQNSEEYANLGQWYWKLGNDIAYAIQRASRSKECRSVGEYEIFEGVSNSVFYMLNELSKWNKPKQEMVEDIVKKSCSGAVKKRMYKGEQALSSCTEYMKRKTKYMDERLDCRHLMKYSLFTEAKESVVLMEGKKKRCYLAPSMCSLYENTTPDLAYKVLRFMVNHHKYHRWYPILKRIKFEWLSERQKWYVQIREKAGYLMYMNKNYDSYRKENRQLFQKIEKEIKNLLSKKETIMNSGTGVISDRRSAGLFHYYESQWRKMPEYYEAFYEKEVAWEKEASKLWDRIGFDISEKLTLYDSTLADTFKSCFKLLKCEAKRREKHARKKERKRSKCRERSKAKRRKGKRK